jgi:aldose 1-epimerase
MRRVFGTIDADTVEEVTIASSAGAVARIIGFGAILRDLEVPVGGTLRRVVLGFDALDTYRRFSGHFGATAGRVANRIRGARFVLDGAAYDLDANVGGRHQLHGGTLGFGRRVWTPIAHATAEATFALVSDDGEMGYPGRVTATVTYRLLEPATVEIEMTATTDRPTHVNLAHHSYFNLADAGASDIRDHRLQVAASLYTPLDEELIPSGAIAPVAGTPYDFRTLRSLRAEAPDGSAQGYDLNYVLDRPRGGLAFAARVESPAGDLALECWTTEPGVQVYDGAKIAVTEPGLIGRPYGPRSGLCLEAQRFPNGPNIPHFPDTTVRPGDVYRQVTQYRFIA